MTARDDVIDALAVQRLTRLVTKDKITKGLREAVISHSYDHDKPAHLNALGWEQIVVHDENPPQVAQLVTCPWCMSMWIAFGVGVAHSLFPRLWKPIARALAASQLAGLTANIDVDV